MTQSLENTIKASSFFTGTDREVESVTVSEFMVNVQYREKGSTVPSTLLALRAPFREEARKKPAYVMAISLGCVIKRNLETSTYTLKVAANNANSDDVSLEYTNSLDEEDFFQQSLLNDFRTLTYDHVKIVDELVEIVADFESNASEA